MFYNDSVAYKVTGMRVIGDGAKYECMFGHVEEDDLVVLSLCPWLSIVKDVGTITVPTKHHKYYLSILRTLNFTVETVNINYDTTQIRCLCPFTLPEHFRVQDMYLIYEKEDGAIGLELTPEAVALIIR